MRVIVVAGATSALGQAISLKLAQNGARVAGLSEDAAKLEQIAKEAALSGGDDDDDDAFWGGVGGRNCKLGGVGLIIVCT